MTKLKKIFGKYITRFNSTLKLPKFDNYCSLIIFPEKNLFSNEELASRAHITVNPGIHKPEKMKDVAQKIYKYLNKNLSNNGENKIILKKFNKKTTTNYEYVFNKSMSIDVNFISIFYI